MVKTPGVLVLDNQGHQQSTEMLKQWRQGWRERGPHSGPILSTKCLQAARDFALVFIFLIASQVCSPCLEQVSDLRVGLNLVPGIAQLHCCRSQ